VSSEAYRFVWFTKTVFTISNPTPEDSGRVFITMSIPWQPVTNPDGSVVTAPVILGTNPPIDGTVSADGQTLSFGGGDDAILPGCAGDPCPSVRFQLLFGLAEGAVHPDAGETCFSGSTPTSPDPRNMERLNQAFGTDLLASITVTLLDQDNCTYTMHVPFEYALIDA